MRIFIKCYIVSLIYVVIAILFITPEPASGKNKHIEYTPRVGVSGNLIAEGSETLQPLMEAWGSIFKKYYPDVTINFNARGSATALPSLISGNSNLAPMSIKINEEDIKKFKNKFGYEPLYIRVALDALSIFVNKNNPLNGITIQQLDGIFSSTYLCGGENITHWSSLVFGTLSDSPVHIYGRNKLSGSYEYFRNKALCGGLFKESIKEFGEQKDVVNAVANDINGIGYGGLAYKLEGVKVLAVADNEDGSFITYYLEKYKNNTDAAKKYANVISGKYPLSRFLYIYINKAPKKKLEPFLEEFLRFILSKEGQSIVNRTGYIPLTEKMVKKELKKLEANYKANWWAFW